MEIAKLKDDNARTLDIFPNCRNEIHCESRKESHIKQGPILLQQHCDTPIIKSLLRSRFVVHWKPPSRSLSKLEECPTRLLPEIHFRLQVPWVHHQLSQSEVPANVRRQYLSRSWNPNERSCQKQSRNRSSGYPETVVMMLSLSTFLRLKDRFWFLI